MAKVIKGLNEEQTKLLYQELGLDGWYDCHYPNLFPHVTDDILTQAANDEFDRSGWKETKAQGNFLVTTITRKCGDRDISTTYMQCVQNDHSYETEFSNLFKEVK